MATARDVMCTNLITILRTETVEQAIRTLLEHRISGAPVVDHFGNLVGVVSEFRLLEVIYDPKVKQDHIDDIMTREVLTVSEDTPLTDVASQFLVHRIRRLPVVRGERLVGVIARSDLLHFAIGDEVAMRRLFPKSLPRVQACG